MGTDKRKSILVAEDDESNFLLAKAILKGEYDLEHVTNGVDAVTKVKTASYDLVLMDIKMPEMNGLDATREIRKFNPTIPIIAFTAYAFDSDHNAATAAGCNYYLTKPMRRSELLEAIILLINK